MNDQAAPKSSIDPAHFRRVLGNLPTGVVAVTAIGPDGRPAGMAVGSFTSVSLDPPLVAFFPDKSSSSFPHIHQAGRFVANLLTAEQEWVCRAFAKKGGDKFSGVGWAPAPVTGGPVLDDCLAYIDCETESVSEAGDHYVVMGRVVDLQTRDESLPLLFFRGGYGRFASLSLSSSAHSEWLRELHYAETARAQMEQLANAFDVECLAIVRQDADMVVLASSGGSQERTLPTRVGRRMPLIPPMGAALVAWDDEASELWLGLRRSASTTREALEASLRRVRERGWSLGLASDTHWRYQDVVSRIPPEGPTPDQVREFDELADAVLAEDSEPEALAAGAVHQVRSINAPVFGPDGRVAMMLSLFGFRQLSTEEVHAQLERLLVAAEVTSAAINGRAPAPLPKPRG